MSWISFLLGRRVEANGVAANTGNVGVEAYKTFSETKRKAIPGEGGFVLMTGKTALRRFDKGGEAVDYAQKLHKGEGAFSKTDWKTLSDNELVAVGQCSFVVVDATKKKPELFTTVKYKEAPHPEVTGEMGLDAVS